MSRHRWLTGNNFYRIQSWRTVFCDNCSVFFSSVEIVRLDVSRNLLLPSVAIIQQLLLVVQQLFPGLCAELEVGSLDYGVHWTCLLTQSTVDALGHVNVVSGGPPTSVLSLFRLDCDRLKNTLRLTPVAYLSVYARPGMCACFVCVWGGEAFNSTNKNLEIKFDRRNLIWNKFSALTTGGSDFDTEAKLSFAPLAVQQL